LTWARFLKRAKMQNYRISIYFLFLKNVSQNLERIRMRVSMGGHNIPKDAVLRRQSRCFHNFWNIYRPLADEWYLFDNSSAKPILILSNQHFSTLSAREGKRLAEQFMKGRFRGIK
ncbi:MAG: hypothetical protein ABL927_13950, partial [Bdellovibrionales bacterium]